MTGLNPVFPCRLSADGIHTFELAFGDDLAAARRKGLVPKIEVSVMTDLPEDRLPAVRVRGKMLAGGVQKDGIAIFGADDETFAKGGNAVEITVPEATMLRDFSVRVTFATSPHPPYRPVGADTGVRGEATGFFHVETFDGRDWIVDPVGRAIVLAGIDWCQHWGMHCEALGYAPYGKFVSENYPSADAWAEQTSRRLAEWGFSFLAVGPSPPMRYRSLAHANGSDSVYFSTHLCQGDDPDRWISPYRHAPGTAFPNVFHPDFEKTCDELARKRCAEHVDDPWLVGYFIDNELRWWGLGDTATGLFEFVRTLPPEHSARKALDAFVAEKSGGAGAEPPLSVKRAFVALVAETYFSTLASAIRKADPNHLLLGCRFAGLDYAPEILSACGRHCDVVSVNVYPWADLDTGIVLDRRGGVPVADALRVFHERADGAPLLVTEWSFPALDSGLPCTVGAGQRFQTQAERAQASEMFLRTLFSLPFLVGHDYFMWQDDPPLGFNQHFHENSNYGLVNLRDEPYAELTAMFARVHGEAARLRLAGLSEAVSATTAATASVQQQGSERERFFSEAAEGVVAGVPSPAAPVAFHLAPDGSWTLSNGLVRLSGRIGGSRMADEIAWGGRVVGRWGALLEWDGGGTTRWTEVSRVTDVAFSRDETTGIGTVTIRAEASAGGAGSGDRKGQRPDLNAETALNGKADSIRFAITDRLSLAPSSGEILAEIVKLENTGDVPLPVRYLFLRPFATEADPQGVRGNTVPNLWKGPVEGWWRLSDGAMFGFASIDSGVVSAYLWYRDEDATQHPDVRCVADQPFTLAPGASYEPPVPMGARLVFLDGG